ncbi:kinase-like protein [Pluteus cervinus]|uniref:Kinase-like protein n=1 Tax=Pluteus cervinus TaxID=181527 RepID=A0ACD3AQY5_9AGAR|nr:kinase-like protein [Pluteus cervinus]
MATSIILSVLDLAPVPCLKAAFTVLKFIWEAVEESKTLAEQWKTLTGIIANYLKILDESYKSGRIMPANTKAQLDALDALLQEILKYKRTESHHGFLKSLYLQGEHITAIEQFHRRIAGCLNAFNITSLLNIQHWQEEHSKARERDQDELNNKLSMLESNQSQLSEMLKDQHSSMMAMMVSLQKSINKSDSSDRQKQFYSHSLKYLSSASGEHVQLAVWMITSFEIEFGEKIGSGGFGQVFKGTWNKTPVALKVFQAETGGIPSSASIKRELEAWVNLRHPHILQFLGANILDERPFIVMPLMRNGNARDFIVKEPRCDRLKILHDASLGLMYLHTLPVPLIHGDLKGLNILIDDAGNAVLCDFGLSRVRADASSHSTHVATSVAGSRNWMSPERLMGGALKKPVDIYAFGMTIYELYAEDMPLGHVPYNDFIDLVVARDTRPERPDEDEAPALTDELWDIAERCWVKNPKERPTAAVVCDDLQRCRDNNKHSSFVTSPISATAPGASPVNWRPLPTTPPGNSSGNISVRPPQQSYGNEAAATLPALPSRDSEPWKKSMGAPASFSSPATSPSSSSTLTSNSLNLRPNRVKNRTFADVISNYTAKDNHQMTITKGERIEILDQTGQWWIARKIDNTEGVVPSTYLKIVPSEDPSKAFSLPNVFGGNRNSSFIASGRLGSQSQPVSMNHSVSGRSSISSRARARHPYVAQRTHELSFSKGDSLEILDRHEQWWIARTQDGKEGLVPSNYVQLA